MSSPVTAIYDACVLYPAPLRVLLIRQAQADLVSHMSGAIRTVAFEDQYSPRRDPPDEAVQQIVRQVCYMHETTSRRPSHARPGTGRMVT